MVQSPDELGRRTQRPGAGARWRKALRLGLALAGLGFFVYLVAASGIRIETLARIGGSGVLLLLALSALIVVLDTLAWRAALRSVARPTLAQLLGLRIAGDALTNSLPGGIAIGEGYKAVLLGRWAGVSVADAAAAQLLVKFGLALSQALFVLVGLLLVYPLLRARSTELFGFGGAHVVALVLIGGFMGLMLVALVLVFRGGSFAGTARQLGRLLPRSLRGALARQQPKIVAFDERSSLLLRHGRRHLLQAFALLVLSWLAAALETYALLGLLGVAVPLRTAFVIESVGSMFRLLFFAVPSGIGGQDASLLALFKLHGLNTITGGAFVLLKRAKELVWIGLGYALIVAFRRRAAIKRAAAGAVLLSSQPQPPTAANGVAP